MFITEMIFSGKHYYRQKDLQECFELCKALPIESVHTEHCATSGTQSAWWTYQNVSICFKATFNTPQEMLAVCHTLLSVPTIPKYDKYKRPVKDDVSPMVYGEITKILRNTPCTV